MCGHMDEDLDSNDLPHVNLVVIGPCSGGKSTIAGRFIVDSGAIDKENFERIFEEAASGGKSDRCFAWILDKLKCERERGGTMYVALWRLASRRCRFTVIDAPGHNDFSTDIVTAMSQADIAVLVVPAVAEDLEDNQECEGQIREHTLLAYTLGLRHLVVCVNKMDNDSVAYSEDHFDRACSIVRQALQNVGLKTHDVYFDVHFVPTSGCTGENIIARSENMPWYCGPTLVEALDDTVASHFKPDRPLRFPIREVMKIGGRGVVVVGRVETGSLKRGSRLVFNPGNVYTQVLSITMHHETLDEAFSGSIVNVTVDAEMSKLSHGMVGAALDDDSPKPVECRSFLAQIIVLSAPRSGEISAGCVLWIACHTSQVPCVVDELLSRTDRRTGKILEMMPSALHVGDAAVVRFRPETPLCVEPFAEYPPLGRFSVHDAKVTVAVGVVQQVDYNRLAMIPPAPTIPEPTMVLTTPITRSSPSELPSRHTRTRAVKAHATEPKRETLRDRFASAVSDSGGDEGLHIASPCPTLRRSFGREGRCLAERSSPERNAAVSGEEAGYSVPSKKVVVGLNTSPFAAFGAVAAKKRQAKAKTRYRCNSEAESGSPDSAH